MATKSILKSVDIRDKHFGRQFVQALETSEKEKIKKVSLSKSIKKVRKDKVKDIFK